MRLLHTADLHIGLRKLSLARGATTTRLEEAERILTRLLFEAIDREADMVIVAGDIFDNRHPNARELALWAWFCGQCHEKGIRVVVVGGNHDGYTQLANPESSPLFWQHADGSADVFVTPGVRIIGDACVVGFPYPHRRAFDGMLAAQLPEDRVVEASRYLTALIEKYTEEAKVLAGGRPLIFVGHLTVGGSVTSTEKMMRSEWDIAVPAEVFEPYDYVALGHIHKRQTIGKAQYPGSPLYIDFGEARATKSFLLVDVDTASVAVSEVPTGCDPMARVRLNYHPFDAGAQLTGIGELKANLIELQITGAERPPEEWVARQEATFYAAGAVFVKTRIDTEDRSLVRLPAQEDAPDLTDRSTALTHYLRRRNLPDEPYVSRAATLTEEHHGDHQ